LIEVFKNATAFWEDASSVRFKYTPNTTQVKIELIFQKFDGPGGEKAK
jgi:hypothetical protein